MAFLDHIVACNTHDIDKFLPFLLDGQHVGWVRHDISALLGSYPDVFRIDRRAVTLQPRLVTPEERSIAVDAVCDDLALKHNVPRRMGERYAVAPRWGDPLEMTLDRAVACLFGVRAYGVHVNGLVQQGEALSLWIARRADNRDVAPGKLDNLIAGGQPAHLSLMENLVKEAKEEANVPAPLAQKARLVGAVSYCMENKWGLKPDTMFCYDLEIPPDFTPQNLDGEIQSFQCLPVSDVLDRVRETWDFKLNVNLVIIDFLIRKSILTPDNEPNYLELVKGLRRDWMLKSGQSSFFR